MPEEIVLTDQELKDSEEAMARYSVPYWAGWDARRAGKPLDMKQAEQHVAGWMDCDKSLATIEA